MLLSKPFAAILGLGYWLGLCLLLSLGSTSSLAAPTISQAETSLQEAEKKLATLFSHIDQLRQEQVNLIQAQRSNDTEIQRLNQRIDSHKTQLEQLVKLEAQWRLLPKPGFLPDATEQNENLRRYWITQLRNSHYMLARSMQILNEEKQRITQENQAKQTNILALIEQQEALSQDILNQIQTRKNLVKRLKSEEDYAQRRQKIQQESLAKLALAEPIQQNGLKYTQFSQLRGQLPAPTLGTKINNPDRKYSLLFEQEESEPVYAVARGKVVFADWVRGVGNLLVIDHGDNYLSLYGHNRNLTREVNEWVEMGDIIAYSGNSGGLDQIGLLFEIRKDGENIAANRWFAN